MPNEDDPFGDDFLATLTPDSIFELGRIFGKIDGIEEAKRAIAEGRAEEWLEENEPKTMEEWDQYEAVYGNRITRLVREITAKNANLVYSLDDGEILRIGIEAGLRGFYDDDQAE